MKRVNSILAVILLLITAGCGGKYLNGDLIIVDVTKSYPKKELYMQDFADVEYITLESADEFLNQGWVRFVSNDFIFVRNRYDRDAILIFDRHTGKALHKISRQGQGPEEYLSPVEMVFDEDRKELFVMDYASRKLILVYDLEGQFKRSFSTPEEAMYSNFLNYDRDYLFGGNGGSWDESGQKFHILSKQDGSLVRIIEIPFKQKVTLPVISPSGYWSLPSVRSLVLFKNELIITELSTDTVYRYSLAHGLQPFIVRTPSIHSMSSPGEVYFSPILMSERYYFMRTSKMEFPFGAKTPEEELAHLPQKELVYDTKDKAIYEYKLYNADINNKTEVEYIRSRNNSEIIFMYSFDAYKLVEYYKKGELKGRLKEIAATLDEEDNPVVMLVKHKK